MWKKSALKRLFKLLPKTNFSDQLIAAISHDYENEIDDLKQTKEEKYSNIFEEIQDATIINEPLAKKKKAEPGPTIFPETDQK
jgi:hypothetical protein